MGWAEPCGRVCEPLEIGSRALFPGNGCPGGPGARDAGCQRSISESRTVDRIQHRNRWHREDAYILQITTGDQARLCMIIRVSTLLVSAVGSLAAVDVTIRHSRVAATREH